MAERYPLVDQREYGRPERRGGLLRRRAVRDDDDLPRIAAHQVRVFRVGESYVEDHGQLAPDDPVVVGASSVTVVDRRVEVPVVVEMRIPSAGTGDFTVRAWFHCTVNDPCAVVRDGVTDVEALLLAHLREVPGLTEDGCDLPVDDAATVRARIDARLTAYHEMRPAQVSGVRVRHGMIEVLTPEEMSQIAADVALARWERERDRVREELEQQAALDRELRQAELELKREEIRNLQALREGRNRHAEAMDEELGRQEIDTLRGRYERVTGAEQQEHELTLTGRRNQFVRAAIQQDFETVGSDPLAADFLAWRNGDITADELSQRLHAAEERGDARKDDRYRLDREDAQERRTLDREDLRWRIEREDRRRELERQEQRDDAAERRREEARRWEREHEETLRRLREEREDMLQAQAYERQWAQEQLAVRADLGKQAIDRGLFDSTRHDAGAFINSVGDVPFHRPGQGGGPDEAARVPAAAVRGELDEGGTPAPDGEPAGRDDGDGDGADDGIDIQEAHLGRH